MWCCRWSGRVPRGYSILYGPSRMNRRRRWRTFKALRIGRMMTQVWIHGRETAISSVFRGLLDGGHMNDAKNLLNLKIRTILTSRWPLYLHCELKIIPQMRPPRAIMRIKEKNASQLPYLVLLLNSKNTILFSPVNSYPS